MKYVVNLNGKAYEVEVEETQAVIMNVTDAPVAAAPVAPVAAPAPAAAPAPEAAPAPAAAPAAPVSGGTNITAPMPGTILAVNKPAGSTVAAGDVILVLEAMKMENEIVAPCAGTVAQVLVSKGSTVETDAVLAVIA
ncbi:MAG: acetyl-CoA carboxylase biotin carboxyl carrier protein subunit [Clostridia bacterium]|nr:acetyl-CoA carboxylase biotin carboxyl carrier protein subunit [Clostridia bacterium]